MLVNALVVKMPPLYREEQVRHWLYVDDYARALLAVLANGRSGKAYNIVECNENKNIEAVIRICALPDGLAPF